MSGLPCETKHFATNTFGAVSVIPYDSITVQINVDTTQSKIQRLFPHTPFRTAFKKKISISKILNFTKSESSYMYCFVNRCWITMVNNLFEFFGSVSIPNNASLTKMRIAIAIQQLQHTNYNFS